MNKNYSTNIVISQNNHRASLKGLSKKSSNTNMVKRASIKEFNLKLSKFAETDSVMFSGHNTSNNQVSFKTRSKSRTKVPNPKIASQTVFSPSSFMQEY